MNHSKLFIINYSANQNLSCGQWLTSKRSKAKCHPMIESGRRWFRERFAIISESIIRADLRRTSTSSSTTRTRTVLRMTYSESIPNLGIPKGLLEIIQPVLYNEYLGEELYFSNWNGTEIERKIILSKCQWLICKIRGPNNWSQIYCLEKTRNSKFSRFPPV